MESGEQKAQDQHDGQDQAQAELIKLLQDFSLKMYANREDDTVWHGLLEAAPDAVLDFFSQSPDMLTDVLSAENEDQVKALVLADVQSSAGMVKADTQDDAETADESGQANDANAEAAKAEAQDAVVDQTSEIKDAAQKEHQASISDGNTEEANAAQDDASTDQALAHALRSIYAAKDSNDGLTTVLQNLDNQVLARLDENPFYISEALKMSTENDLNEFIDGLLSAVGPAALVDALEDEAIGEESIDCLQANWAYISMDCKVGNPENQGLKNAGLLDGKLQWMSDAGVPVVCMPHADDAQTITMAVSMQGSLSGVDPYIDTSLVNMDALSDAVTKSPVERRMWAAYDLVSFAHAFELGDIKLRAGQREFMRNVWAICKLNAIACVGFEPTPVELIWYEKREMVLKSHFALTQTAELTHTASMAPTGMRSEEVHSQPAGAMTDAQAGFAAKQINKVQSTAQDAGVSAEGRDERAQAKTSEQAGAQDAMLSAEEHDVQANDQGDGEDVVKTAMTSDDMPSTETVQTYGAKKTAVKKPAGKKSTAQVAAKSDKPAKSTTKKTAIKKTSSKNSDKKAATKKKSQE